MMDSMVQKMYKPIRQKSMQFGLKIVFQKFIQ